MSSTQVIIAIAGVVQGTLGYMAPEMILKSAIVGKPADVYSFGAVLWEIVTGKLSAGYQRGPVR